MKTKVLKATIAAACCIAMTASCTHQPESTSTALTTVGNPYLPLWEHIPDGEPYVFDDPDNPGKQRVYIYGSHDNLTQIFDSHILHALQFQSLLSYSLMV